MLLTRTVGKGRWHGPGAGTGVATVSRKEVGREKHEKVRISNFCFKRMMATFTT